MHIKKENEWTYISNLSYHEILIIGQEFSLILWGDTCIKRWIELSSLVCSYLITISCCDKLHGSGQVVWPSDIIR